MKHHFRNVDLYDCQRPRAFLFPLSVLGAFILSLAVFGCSSAIAQTSEESPQDIQLQQSLPPDLSSLSQEAASGEGAVAAPTLGDMLSDLNSDGSSSQGNVNSSAMALDDGTGLSGYQLPPAAKTKEQEQQELRKEAFDGVVSGRMPLKPSEIRRAMELYDETVQAIETPLLPSPEPESSFVQASLEPGSKPVVIKTAVSNVTTVSIVDATGQPWPIKDMTWAGQFQVEQPEPGSHMLRIAPTAQFAQGMVSMRLVGLNPPVIFSLRTDRKTVHVRLDVQIPEIGPNGVLPPVMTPVSIKAGDESMTKVLLGVPSQAGLKKIAVEGVDGRTSAYRSDTATYVRTPYTLLSPAWSKSVKSADGMNVYVLDNTPVLLLSDKGKMVRAYLSPMEQTDGQ